MSARVLGAVLAGGFSSRFGSDKAAALLESELLIDHVAARLAEQVDTLIIVGRKHPPLPSIPDRPAPGLGPLGGLSAALRHALDQGYAAVVTAGCDLPLLPPDLVHRLAGDGPATIADCPVVGWWPAALSPLLDHHLDEGGSRSVRRWAERVGARELRLPEPFANINTPADLERVAQARRARSFSASNGKQLAFAPPSGS